MCHFRLGGLGEKSQTVLQKETSFSLYQFIFQGNFNGTMMAIGLRRFTL